MKILIGILITAMMVVGSMGCRTIGDASPEINNVSSAALDQASNSLKNTNSDLASTNANTNELATDISVKSDEIASSTEILLDNDIKESQKKVIEDIRLKARSIFDQAQKILQNVIKTEEKLKTNQKDVKVIEKGISNVKDLEKKIANLVEANGKLRSDAIQNVYSYLAAFFGLGFLVIVAGIAIAVFVNPKLGISLVVLGVLGLATAAALIYYLEAIAMISIAIIIGVIVISVGLGVYYLVRVNKDKDVKEQAVVENITLVEKMKDYLDPESKKEIFGTDTSAGIAQEIQSDSTKKLIHKIKKDVVKPALGNKKTP